MVPFNGLVDSPQITRGEQRRWHMEELSRGLLLVHAALEDFRRVVSPTLCVFLLLQAGEVERT